MIIKNRYSRSKKKSLIISAFSFYKKSRRGFSENLIRKLRLLLYNPQKHHFKVFRSQLWALAL